MIRDGKIVNTTADSLKGIRAQLETQTGLFGRDDSTKVAEYERRTQQAIKMLDVVIARLGSDGEPTTWLRGRWRAFLRWAFRLKSNDEQPFS